MDDLDRRFGFHPATNDVVAAAHQQVRQMCREVAAELTAMLPDSRERSLAITKLEEAMMWGNAAIARGTAVPQ
jgi:hypothetical protein